MADSAELPVALTFDLDPDQFDSSIGSDYASDRLGWRGVEIGVPALVEILDELSQTAGQSLKATWLLRCDNQIAALYGDAGAIVDRNRRLIDSLIARGDEIGWHPHLSRRNGGHWVQETQAATYTQILQEGHAAMLARGLHPTATRMGGNYGANALLSSLGELGIRVDSSAMPGRSREDGERVFDWCGAPEQPYRPALADYRRGGAPAQQVIEVPLTMVPVQATYDDRPYPRYVDLSFHAELLQPALETRLIDCPLLVCDTHPSTVLSEVFSNSHGLLSFSLSDFKRNILTILNHAGELGRQLRFITLSECAAMAI